MAASKVYGYTMFVVEGIQRASDMKKRNFRKHDLQRPKYPCGKDPLLGHREVVKGLGWFFGLSAVGASLFACTEDYGDGDDRGFSEGVAPPYDADAGLSDVPDIDKPNGLLGSFMWRRTRAF